MRQFSQIVAAGGSFRRYSVWGIAIEPIVCSCISFFEHCMCGNPVLDDIAAFVCSCGSCREHCMCGNPVLDDIAAFVCSWILLNIVCVAILCVHDIKIVVLKFAVSKLQSLYRFEI